MFGLFSGKPRTKIGRFLDQRGITQEWLAARTKINRNTISKIASDKDYEPRLSTIKKLMKVINEEIDPNKKMDDFFDL